jgi:hypothetical protein
MASKSKQLFLLCDPADSLDVLLETLSPYEWSLGGIYPADGSFEKEAILDGSTKKIKLTLIVEEVS